MGAVPLSQKARSSRKDAPSARFRKGILNLVFSRRGFLITLKFQFLQQLPNSFQKRIAEILLKHSRRQGGGGGPLLMSHLVSSWLSHG